jgi:hypothetical protein
MKFFCFFASLKSLKKEFGSRVGSGSGSISQRYGSGDPDPDHQNVTDPQHWFVELEPLLIVYIQPAEGTG